MLRIRITANELTAVQAKEIARIAYELGYGIVDVTTRANIQVQGLDIEDVPRALQRLEAVGLTSKQTGLDNVRNVFGHPLSGVDPDELIDTRPLCRDITKIFLDHREFADLPRKFNIALCGRADAAIHYWTQDLAFLAVSARRSARLPRLDRRQARTNAAAGATAADLRAAGIGPAGHRGDSRTVPRTRACAKNATRPGSIS